MNESVLEIVVRNNETFGTVDYVVFVAMLLVSTSIGIWFGCFGQSEQTTEEYLLGGRRMKTWPIAISLIASQLSGISIMAVPAELYSFGAQYWIICPCIFLTTLVINYIFIPVFYNNHISNVYEYLESRFSKAVRQIITASFVLSVYLILPVMMFIPSLALSQVSGIDIHLINAIVSGVCMLYTMLGGIKAVVWTDVIQASVMLASLLLVFTLAIIQVGGIGTVIERASNAGRLELFNMDLNPEARHTFWNTVFGYLVMWASYTGLNQSCVQRIVSVPTIQHARKSMWIFAAGFFIIMSLNCFTGIVMFAKYYDCDPVKAQAVSKADKMVPYFIQDVVGHLTGMPGIFISCVFSAALSTLSANMNALSGIVYEDYIRKLNLFKHTERSANICMKSIVIVTGVYCICMGVFVEKFAHILQMVMTIAGVTSGASMGVFCMGMLWPWANKKGALSGVIVSTVVLFWIVVNAQILIQNGDLVYPPLPSEISVESCAAHGINVTGIINSTLATVVQATEDRPFSIYRLSFAWYGALGSIIVVIVGIPVSYFTGGEDVKALGPRLITPIAHFLLPPEAFATEVPLEVVDKEKEKLNNTDILEKSEYEWHVNGKKK